MCGACAHVLLFAPLALAALLAVAGCDEPAALLEECRGGVVVGRSLYFVLDGDAEWFHARGVIVV